MAGEIKVDGRSGGEDSANTSEISKNYIQNSAKLTSRKMKYDKQIFQELQWHSLDKRLIVGNFYLFNNFWIENVLLPCRNSLLYI